MGGNMGNMIKWEWWAPCCYPISFLKLVILLLADAILALNINTEKSILGFE